MPSQKHEEKAVFLEKIVEVIADERGIESRNIRSTTFKKDSAKKGVEPDGCFYLQSYDKVFGMETIDLEQFPPDLVIEVDIFSPSIDRFPIYAEFKVPEIWRYKNEKVTIHLFDGEEYIESNESLAFQSVTSEQISGWLSDSETKKRSEWLKQLRHEARTQN